MGIWAVVSRNEADVSGVCTVEPGVAAVVQGIPAIVSGLEAVVPGVGNARSG